MKSLLLLLFIFLYRIMSTSGQEILRFEAQELDNNVSIGYGLAIGDVDGDEDLDILLADQKQFVWYRNPDWTRFVMVDSLTERDNVCLAAADIDGDGKVEVAVGAQWNPGETSDAEQSGSIHYLIRPEDPTQLWEPVALPHVPTIHRMQWAQHAPARYQLIVLPLHGIGNTQGEGEGVKVLAFDVPEQVNGDWEYTVIDSTMHLTHNFDVVQQGHQSTLFIGGKEGIQPIASEPYGWIKDQARWEWGKGFSEVRIGKGVRGRSFLAGIEPLHGNMLTVYWIWERQPVQQILATDLNQGHALACADLLATGQDQVVVGWREPNADDKVGIRIYEPQSDGGWKMHLVDDNEMACEDLKIADLDADGKPDIIAAGRATHNLKVYWNKN